MHRFAYLGAAAVLLATTLLRFTVHHDAPIWLDESFTGMIAGQDDIASFLSRVRDDAPNAPLFYLIEWLWTKFAGLSDAALRIPAAMFGAAAPIIPLVSRTPCARSVRITWCVLLALWIPGIEYSQEARGYTLLLCLSIASNIYFIRILNDLTLRSATIWCVICSASVLTHYYSAILYIIQGLIFIYVRRGEALRVWPALIVTAVPAAWLALQIPRIAAFSHPGIAWYSLLTPHTIYLALMWLVGSMWIQMAFSAWTCIALFKNSRGAEPDRAVWLAAAASLMAAIVVVGIGVFRPTFTFRYLLPFAPGFLLGLAQIACDERRRFKPSPAILCLIFGGGAAFWAATSQPPGTRVYSFESASAWIAEHRPARLAFLWDHPATPLYHSSTMADLGGFFLQRAGMKIPVVPVAFSRERDPNDSLESAAQADGGILWIYDRGLPPTLARAFPPRMKRASLECRDFGRGLIGIYACRPNSSVVYARK